jgi:PIN domain nuclease of toxin-antitoxin system
MQVSPEQLSDQARDLIRDVRHELFFSAASSWEIAIKYALGKLALPTAPAVYVSSRLEGSGVTAIPIEHVHALRVAELPPHHRDPFDRLLVAQAQLDGLTLLTVDPQFKPYGIELIWAR